ncbi:helix-turn-helix transcriptional regulator [Dactylosporangium sp. CA-092794]|uniref:helix-turn-helix transcriptional regulator n=1 Tax=Dactylosporangium sp. CA-092794 TaxID=3239929 RepID=UPI003D8A517F
MSAADLARASGVARATLSRLEAGHGNPTLDTIGALAGDSRRSLSQRSAATGSLRDHAQPGVDTKGFS